MQSYSNYSIMADMSSTKEEDLSPNLGPRVDSDNTTSVFNEWTTIIPEEEKVEVPGGLKAPRFNPREALLGTTRYGVTLGLNILSFIGLEGVALTGATFAAGINSLASLDSKYAIAALALSYVPLITGTLKNAEQAWHSMKVLGVSISAPAKLGYDLSRVFTKNEKIHKAATYTGFLGFELAKEIPWYAAAFSGKEIMGDWIPERITPNIEYAFLAGANIAGAGYQYAQAGGIEVLLRGIRNRGRIMNSFRRGGIKITPSISQNPNEEHLQKGP